MAVVLTNSIVSASCIVRRLGLLGWVKFNKGKPLDAAWIGNDRDGEGWMFLHLHVVKVLFLFVSGGDYVKFAIIGTGVVGTALAVSLERAGHSCVGVNTRSGVSYQSFSRYLDVPHLSLGELIPQADLLFITTHDGEIRSVAEHLAAQTLQRDGQVWIHCSGAHPSGILRVEGVPISCLSIHPLQSFADVDRAVELLGKSHFSVEGDRPELGMALVKDLGGIPHWIPTANKVLYHAGAVMASNYVVVLASLATKFFELAGFERTQALDALLPLMEGALKNLSQLGLPQALTGPLARGDVDVVRSHLEQMPASLACAYSALAPEALNLAIQKWAENGKEYPAGIYADMSLLFGRGSESNPEPEAGKAMPKPEQVA